MVTRKVPGSYRTIAAAIDASSSGDLILIADGYAGPQTAYADFDSLTVSASANVADILLMVTGRRSTLTLAGTAPIHVSGIGGPLTVVGNAGANALLGSPGNDVLKGGGGDDYIDGRGGVDRLEGGAGNDLFRVFRGGGQVDGGSGIDTVGDLSGDLGAVTFRNVEILDTPQVIATAAQFASFATITNSHGPSVYLWLKGAGGTLDLSGRVRAVNTLVLDGGLTAGITVTGSKNLDGLSGSAFNDVLRGGDGDDVLGGGAGNDTLDGGDGSDTADYRTSRTGIAVRLDTTAAQDTGDGRDILVRIENLYGTGYADRLTGNASDNRLLGGPGNDVLSGAAGNDILEGGDDDDTLDGGIGIDTASYAAAGAGVRIQLATVATAQATLGAGSDRLSGFENLLGSAFDDSLTGDAGSNGLVGAAGNDQLLGGLGDDRLEGGRGRDTLRGQGGRDVFVFQAGDSAATATAVDTVVDFLSGSDKVDLDTIGAGGLLRTAYAEVKTAGATFLAAASSASAAMARGTVSVVFVAGATDGWLFWNTDANLTTAEQAVRLNGLNTVAAFAPGDLM